MYTAKVIKANNIQPHSNADNLNILHYNGLQFIIGKDIEEGELVCLFTSDGQLSEEFCKQNNLYRHSYLNQDLEKSGFFEDNRRITAIRLRGEISNGFVCKLSCFNFTGIKFEPTEGQEFTHVNGIEICRKYFTPATLKAIGNRQSRKSTLFELFFKHLDTEQLAYNIDKLPDKCLVIISEKLHGTSGRTGYIKTVVKYNPLDKLIFWKK